MTIHKEGRGLLLKLFAIGVAVVFGANYFLSHTPIIMYASIGVYSVFFLIVLQFFRQPNRQLVRDEGKIIAPVDGKVVVIEETDEDEYFPPPRELRELLSALETTVHALLAVPGNSRVAPLDREIAASEVLASLAD